jgi:hypothetical protein
LASAFDIPFNELFSLAVSPEMAMEQLQRAILDNINKKLDNLDKTIEHALDKAIEKRCGGVYLSIGNKLLNAE